MLLDATRPPVRFANGSSSNKKSGGGELRGEVMAGDKFEFETLRRGLMRPESCGEEGRGKGVCFDLDFT